MLGLPRVLAVISVLLMQVQWCQVSALSQCSPAPSLVRDLLQPGLLNLVYTMESSCQSCIQQAHRLPRLKRYLEKKGIKTHLIVGVSRRSERLSELGPHLEVNSKRLWRALGKQNNHFYVIDRCGRMVYEIINPWSDLNFPFVRSAVVATQYTHRCGLCPSDYQQETPQRDGIRSFPEQRDSKEQIPEDVEPMRVVVKLRHKHKRDPKIYDYLVNIPEVPAYHGHLPHDGHLPDASTSTTSDEVMHRNDGINLDKSLIIESVSPSRRDTSHNQNDGSLSESTVNPKIGIRDVESSTDRASNVGQIPDYVKEERKDYKNEQGSTSEDYYEEEPPDSTTQYQPLTEEQLAQKSSLLEHYRPILDWVHYSQDYD